MAPARSGRAAQLRGDGRQQAQRSERNGTDTRGGGVDDVEVKEDLDGSNGKQIRGKNENDEEDNDDSDDGDEEESRDDDDSSENEDGENDEARSEQRRQSLESDTRKQVPGLALVDQSIREMLVALGGDTEEIMNGGLDLDKRTMGRMARLQSTLFLEVLNESNDQNSLEEMSEEELSRRNAVNMRSSLLVERCLTLCSDVMLQHLKQRREHDQERLAALMETVRKHSDSAMSDLVTCFHRHIQWMRESYENKLNTQRKAAASKLQDAERLSEALVRRSLREKDRDVRQRLAEARTKHEAKVKELETEVTAQELKVQSMASHQVRLGERIARLSDENEILRDRLGDAPPDMTEDIENLKQQNKAKMEQFQTEVIALKQDLDTAMGAIAARDNEVKQWATKASKQREQIKRFQQRLDDSEVMMKALRANVAESQQQYESASVRGEELRKAAQALKKQLSRAENSIKDQLQQNANMQHVMEETERKHKKQVLELKTAASIVKEKLETERLARAAADDKVAQAQAKVNELQIGVLNAVNSQQHAQREMERAQAKVKELELAHEKERIEVERECESIRQKYNGLKAAHGTEAESHRKQIRARDSEILRLQAWTAELRGKLKDKKDTHESQVEELRGESERERQRLVDSVKALKEEISLLKHKLQAADSVVVSTISPTTRLDSSESGTMRSPTFAQPSDEDIEAEEVGTVFVERGMAAADVNSTQKPHDDLKAQVVIEPDRHQSEKVAAEVVIEQCDNGGVDDVNDDGDDDEATHADDNQGGVESGTDVAENNHHLTRSNIINNNNNNSNNDDTGSNGDGNDPDLDNSKMAGRPTTSSCATETENLSGIKSNLESEVGDDLGGNRNTGPKVDIVSSSSSRSNSTHVLLDRTTDADCGGEKRGDGNKRAVDRLKTQAQRDLRKLLEKDLKKEVRAEMLRRMEKGLTKKVRREQEKLLRQEMEQKLAEETKRLERLFGRSTDDWSNAVEEERQRVQSLEDEVELRERMVHELEQVVRSKSAELDQLYLSIKEKDMLLREITAVTRQCREALTLQLEPIQTDSLSPRQAKGTSKTEQQIANGLHRSDSQRFHRQQQQRHQQQHQQQHIEFPLRPLRPIASRPRPCSAPEPDSVFGTAEYGFTVQDRKRAAPQLHRERRQPQAGQGGTDLSTPMRSKHVRSQLRSDYLTAPGKPVLVPVGGVAVAFGADMVRAIDGNNSRLATKSAKTSSDEKHNVRGLRPKIR